MAITAAITLLVRGVLSSGWLLNSTMVAVAMHPWLVLPIDAGVALAAWCMVHKTNRLLGSLEHDRERARKLKRAGTITCVASIVIGAVGSLLLPFMVGSVVTLTGAQDARAIAATVLTAAKNAGKTVPVTGTYLGVSLQNGRVNILDPAGLQSGDPDLAVCRAIAARAPAGLVTINYRPASAAACTWRFNNHVTVALPAGTSAAQHP